MKMESEVKGAESGGVMERMYRERGIEFDTLSVERERWQSIIGENQVSQICQSFLAFLTTLPRSITI